MAKTWWKYALSGAQVNTLFDIACGAAKPMNRCTIDALVDRGLVEYTGDGRPYVTELGHEWIKKNEGVY